MTASRPGIAVVVPVYRGRAWVAEALRSALELGPGEVVVVDDGCPEHTGDFVEGLGLPGVRVLRQANAGVGAARSAGLADLRTGPEFVVFLDQDDRLRPGGTADLVALLQRDVGLLAAVGHPAFISAAGDPEDGTDYLRLFGVGNQLRRNEMLVRCPVNSPGQAVFRMRALREVGGFDPALTPSDDWDLWIRLLDRGRVAVLERETLDIRRHGSNVSSDVVRMRRAELAVRRVDLERSGPARRAVAAAAFRVSELHRARKEFRNACAFSPTPPFVVVRERHLLATAGWLLSAVIGLRLRLRFSGR